jgi:hypothetical protein
LRAHTEYQQPRGTVLCQPHIPFSIDKFAIKKMYILQLAVLATGFASTAFAQSWVLPVPGQESKFSEGDIVPLQWSTPYAYTNIQLFQGPQADGDYLYTRLSK